MTQEAIKMPCALSFPPALLAQPTPCMEKAKRLKYRQFQLQHLKVLGVTEKPLSNSNTLYSLSLATSQHYLLTVGGTLLLHLFPITAQKDLFFFLSSFSGGCEKRVGSPNKECWRLHDHQQQELQFPVSEVLAMSTVTVNTLFRYSDCQNFKPSSIELVPFHKLVIQSYWIDSHMDGKNTSSSCQHPSHLQLSTCQTPASKWENWKVINVK